MSWLIDGEGDMASWLMEGDGDIDSWVIEADGDADEAAEVPEELVPQAARVVAAKAVAARAVARTWMGRLVRFIVVLNWTSAPLPKLLRHNAIPR